MNKPFNRAARKLRKAEECREGRLVVTHDGDNRRTRLAKKDPTRYEGVRDVSSEASDA